MLNAEEVGNNSDVSLKPIVCENFVCNGFKNASLVWVLNNFSEYKYVWISI